MLAEALKFLDGAEADDRLRVLGCGRGKPTHPELILVRAEDRLKPVLIDALYLAHYLNEADCPQSQKCTVRRSRLGRVILLILSCH
ncbi:MAG: hypothetical protein ACXWVS_13300 [Hyphomicrobium sp.]